MSRKRVVVTGIGALTPVGNLPKVDKDTPCSSMKEFKRER